MDLKKLLFLSIGMKAIIIGFCLSLVGLHYYISAKFWYDPDAKKWWKVESNGEKLDSYDENGFTPLTRAAANGEYEKVKRLVQQGADLELRSKNIDQTRDINQPEGKPAGQTPLHIACYNGDVGKAPAVVEFLLINGANPRVKDEVNGQTPVHLIMWTGSQDTRRFLLELLIKHGADVNAQDAYGNTMVHLAVQADDQGWVELLQRQFGSIVNFNVRNNNGRTPLDMAYSLGGSDITDMAKQLEKEQVIFGIDQVDHRDVAGMTPLMLAVIANKRKLAIQLIKRRNDLLDATIADAEGNTALFLACMHERPEMLKLLIDSGADVNYRNKLGMPPLLYTLRIKNKQKCNRSAKYLIDAGADINAQDPRGNTVFHHLIEENKPGLLSFLANSYGSQVSGLEPMINLAIVNDDGETALELAHRLGRTNMAVLLESIIQAQEFIVLPD